MKWLGGFSKEEILKLSYEGRKEILPEKSWVNKQEEQEGSKADKDLAGWRKKRK